MSDAAPAPAHAPAWEIRRLTHTFGAGPDRVRVLDGLDLAAGPGEFVSLVGPSGCGKSTVLRVLAGLLRPDGGAAYVSGRDVAGRPGSCAFQPQRDSLLPWKRCLDNATIGAEVAGVPRDEAQAAAHRLWERFGLSGYERAWPSALSGGMRQRLALLRAFLVPRDVLLLDEPLGALDAITRRDLQLWLGEVWLEERAASGGRSALLVTHDVEEALLLSDRVVVLSDRPARVMVDVDVGLPRPRPEGTVTGPRFLDLRAQVLSALHAGHRLRS